MRQNILIKKYIIPSIHPMCRRQLLNVKKDNKQ